MSWGGLQWQEPLWLLLLLLLPVVVWASRGRRRPALLLPTTHAVVIAGRGPLARWAWLPLALRSVGLLLITLGLARPGVEEAAGRELSVEGIDVVVALDLSGSMQAVDFQPNDRLHVAKEVLDDFVRRRPSDRMGLVVFAGEAYTQCPLTLDHRVLREILGQVRIGAIPDGTAIGDALATSLNRLRASDAESQVIVLLTDGDSNAGVVSPLEAAKMASDLGVRVFTILVGKDCKEPRGCPVPFPAGTDFFGNPVFRDVRIPTDPELLEAIASRTGGKAYRATDRASLEGNLQDVLAELDKSRLVDERHMTNFQDRFSWFFAPGLLAVLLELCLAATVLRRFP